MMSKELEALENIKDILISYNFAFDKYTADNFNLIEQALTPPTEQEVCDKLSEYFVDKYICEDNKFFNYGGNEPEPVIYNTNYGVVIKYGLPPHLITMIGRFYEGKVQDV